MEYKLAEKNYLVFLDILKKNNIDSHYIRTIKLINELIRKSYVTESYCLIRQLFEEIMYDLALIINPSFRLTMRTSAKRIRKIVTDNREKIFGDLYEEIFFDSIYNYLSKMTHETSLKLLINDISKNKRSKTFVKTNQMCIFSTVIHILITSTTINPELIELSNYLLLVSNKLIAYPATEFESKLKQDDIDRYNHIFSDNKDKEYLDNQAKEAIDLFESLNTPEIVKKQNKAAVRVVILLKKYSYDEIYNK